ncbi:hypothetical protein PTKIN_Ptkin03bG0070300 [Pterospermum kingtungense]
MDMFTAHQLRLAYARVCIEIDVQQVIPREIEVVMRSGKVVKVQVTVPWMPLKCSKCKIFGHADRNCARKEVHAVSKKWVPKVNGDNKNVVDQVTKGVTLEAGSIVDSIVAGKMVVTSGSKKEESSGNGRGGSVNRFEILNSPITSNETQGITSSAKIAEDAPSKVQSVKDGVPSSVANLMASLKAAVQDQLKSKEIKVFKKGDVNKDKAGTPSVEEKGKRLVEDLLATDGEQSKNIAVDEDNISDDSYDEFHHLDQNSRKKSLGLAAIGPIRPQRLTAAGVKEAVQAVKARNRKSRRQIKKASAKKASAG